VESRERISHRGHEYEPLEKKKKERWSDRGLPRSRKGAEERLKKKENALKKGNLQEKGHHNLNIVSSEGEKQEKARLGDQGEREREEVSRREGGRKSRRSLLSGGHRGRKKRRAQRAKNAPSRGNLVGNENTARRNERGGKRARRERRTGGFH